MVMELDTASVRIQLDTRQALAQARVIGARIGRVLAEGITRMGRGAGRDFAADVDEGANQAIRPVRVPLDAVTAGFRAQVQRAVAEVGARVNAEIPLTARGEAFRAEATRIVREIEHTLDADIPTEPGEAAEYRRKLAAMVRAASSTVTAHVRTDVDRSFLSRASSGLRSLIGLGSEAGGTFQQLAGSAEQVGTSMSRAGATGAAGFGRAAGAVGGVLAAMAATQVVIPGLATGIVGLAGLAVSAFGAITVGVAGLPVVLTALLGPIAAIALGMDGIKRAARVLSDEMDSLRTQVSLAFEQGMAPVFDRLQKLFPTLSVGLSEIAQGVSRFALSLTDVATSDEGIENVRMALGGVSTALDQARPGATELFRSLLRIAGTRNLYVILGDTIGGVSQRLADMLERLRSSGTLEGGLTQLKNVLFSLTDLVAKLAEGSAKFFEKAGPGLTSFIDSLTRTLGKVDWAGLGESFGSMMARLGAAIEKVPPETWRALGKAIGDMVDRFVSAVENGGLQRAIELLAGLVELVDKIGAGLGKAFETFENITLLKGIGESIGNAFKGSGEAADRELQGVDRAVDEHVVSLPERITTAIGGLPEQVGEIFTQVKDKVGEELQQTGDAAEEKTTSLKDRIGEALTGLPEQVDSFLSTLPERVAYWLGYAATTVWLKAQEIFWGIVGFFAQLPGTIEGFVRDMAERVGRFFSELPGKLGELARQAVEAVIGWFSSLPGRAEEKASDMAGRVKRFFSELPGQLAEFARRAVDDVVSKFGELPQKMADKARQMVDDVVKWFEELPGKLKEKGKEAIDGFIEGIQSKAMELWNKAKSVVDSALRGAQDAIDARSPSRKFRVLGQHSIDGYILGLRDRLAPLLAQVRAIMAAAIERAGAALSGPSLNLAGSLSAIPEGFHTATRAAVGTGAASGPDVAALAAAFTAALGAAQWRVQGDDLILTVNRAAERLGRR